MAGIPHIAILGRPNVGKSTLFNRLVGRRLAIVDSFPGVTRDRIEGEFEWENRKYRVSDLAGWDEAPSNPFAAETTEQIRRVSETCDLILLIVDGREGPNAWDKALAEKLRIMTTPVILVVNKCDTVPALGLADIFWELGMGEPIPISATHNLNVDALLDRIAKLTKDLGIEEEVEAEGTITVAIIGKQNAGKSTLFNVLIGDQRAIVSDIPGTTRDAIDTAIEVDGTRFLFIDTAGMKKPARIKESVDYYAIRRTEIALKRCEVALLLIDCEEGVTDTDSKIAGFVQEFSRACIIVASKWDVSEDKPGQRMEYTKHLKKKLHFLVHAPVIFTSGKYNRGTAELFPGIIAVHEQFTRRVATNEWNQALADAVTYRPPPTQKGKRLKLNYITQTSTAPPKITIFVNQPEFLRDSYKRYLEKYFRKLFGFEGAPIVFNVRQKNPKKSP